LIAAGVKERIEQVRTGLIDRDEDVAFVRPEIVIEIERTLLLPVAEDDRMVVRGDLAQRTRQRGSETRCIERRNRFRQGRIPIRRRCQLISLSSRFIASPTPLEVYTTPTVCRNLTSIKGVGLGAGLPGRKHPSECREQA
jgi:hypothetical protein